uniref:Glucose 1-dehydrogenase n=1 Tax=Candidatus Kentrum sp. MB TaxID=2138164 RepID=A0A450XEC8_9GAMM|nr:MAG: glucose 1-dehydrogenase [Candidatus Kentron sp. MB]VFK74358.1 MAG: glucose 1-dehydrogenase [Candidatus Kentron sp. MB]
MKDKGNQPDFKTALCLHASKVQGKASLAYEFADGGAQVAINYIENQEKARSITDHIRNLRYSGQKAECFHADISRKDDLESMIEAIKEIFGKIDILVNNAEVNNAGVNNVGIQTEKPFIDLTEPEIDAVFSVNMKGTFLCSQLVAKDMIQNGSEKIINISSIHQDRPRPCIAHYAMSKGGVNMLTKAMALELAQYNINVNAIAPGAIETPMNHNALSHPEIKNKIIEKNSTGKIRKSK